MPKVVPEVLKWARESAGLSEDDAAKKLGFTDTRTRTAIDRLGAIEAGTEVPSRSVILRMAKQYRRPLVTFYLSKPPEQGVRGEDFRTLPRAPEPMESALVDALVRDIRARQQMIRSALEDGEHSSIDYVGSASAEAGINAMADSISAFIKFSPASHYAAKSPEIAFSSLREKVERTGTFVLLISNLGTHHTSLEPDVFRGFALSDPIAPVIVINDQDSKAAWSFTLLHELAHIWLGHTGISASKPELAIEKFCNDTASRLLLPDSELISIEIRDSSSIDAIAEDIFRFARPRNLSYSLVAYRLYLSNRISKDSWDQLTHRFREMWRRQRANAREKAKEDDSGGPSYYVVKRQKLGNALISLVREHVESGEMTPSKAAKILGVKARSLYPLIGDVSIASGRRP